MRQDVTIAVEDDDRSGAVGHRRRDFSSSRSAKQPGPTRGAIIETDGLVDRPLRVEVGMEKDGKLGLLIGLALVLLIALLFRGDSEPALPPAPRAAAGTVAPSIPLPPPPSAPPAIPAPPPLPAASDLPPPAIESTLPSALPPPLPPPLPTIPDAPK
jgi:hypothetical protein